MAGGNDRPVCRFWQQGNCRKGNNCPYRHPEGQSSSNNRTTNNNNNSNNNRNGNQSNNQNNQQKGGGKNNPYYLDRDAIAADLTPGEEKPKWPLSCYGPGRNAPLQLIHDPHEWSPEEMRVAYYVARAEGTTENYARKEAEAYADAVAEANRILSNLNDAINYVKNGDRDPNSRLKGVHDPKRNFPPETRPHWSAQAPTATGLTSHGHTSNPGINPAFPPHLGPHGAYAPPPKPSGALSFGQPSLLGSRGTAQQPASTFGQPSNAGQQQNPSPFAQPSTFGRPSAFGQQQPQPQSSSGQPSQPAFGQPTAPTQPSAFGQPSGQPSAFGQQGTFGQRSNGGQQGTFGQPSNSAPPPAGFGGRQGTFGQPSNPPRAPAGFGAQQQQQQQSQGGFGQQQAPGNAHPQNGFRQQQQQQQQPPPTPMSAVPTGSAEAADGHRGRPFRNKDPSKPELYYDNPNTGKPERVWLPNGPDAEDINTELGVPPEKYQGEVGEELKRVYQHVWQTGKFPEDGPVPEVPPPREWVNFAV